MRQSHHTESEILQLLIEAHAGLPIPELCRSARISPRTFYRWRARYGGITPFASREVKDLQLENRRLRSLVTRLSASIGAESATFRTCPSLSPVRLDHGCDRTDPSGAKPRGGASLGRFAFVRGTR